VRRLRRLMRSTMSNTNKTSQIPKTIQPRTSLPRANKAKLIATRMSRRSIRFVRSWVRKLTAEAYPGVADRVKARDVLAWLRLPDGRLWVDAGSLTVGP